MRQLIALVALVATAACSSDASPTEPLVGSLEGSYTLSALNGNPLPFTIVSNDTTVRIETDVIILTDAGQWSETVGYRQTVGAAAPTNESFALSGTWTRSGNNLNFFLATSGGLLYQGTATETSLALSDGFYSYLFLR